MKTLVKALVLLTLSRFLFGQAVTSPPLAITQSGNSVTYPNVNKGTQLSFQVVVAGNPTPPYSSTITTSGCFSSGSCDVIDIYTGNATGLRGPFSLSKNYDYFSTQASYTGGSQPTVAVTYTISSQSTTPSSSTQALQVVFFSGTPTGGCNNNYAALDITTANFFDCYNGGWNQVNNQVPLLGGGAYAIQYQNSILTGFSGLNPVLSPAGFTQMLCNTPTSGGAATAPTYCLPGVQGRSVTTTTDTIGNGTGTSAAPGGSTDCAPNRIAYNSTSAVAVGIPTPSSLGVTYCVFKVINQSTGTVTFTPNTWTINGGTTLSLYTNEMATVYVDPSTATNWIADLTCAPVGGATNQVIQAAGVGQCPVARDFPDVLTIKGAICQNGTATPLVSSAGSNFTATCRAGTNNLGATMSGASGTSLQFEIELPGDWDPTNQPYMAVLFDSLTNTSGTVIWTPSSACSSVAGGTTATDDAAFVAESAMGTKTMTAADRLWAVAAQFGGMTSSNNCAAGTRAIIKLALSGTIASPIGFDLVTITIPRKLIVQAN